MVYPNKKLRYYTNTFSLAVNPAAGVAMKKLLFLLLVILASLASEVKAADVEPARTSLSNGCFSAVMCDGSTITPPSVCRTSGNDRVLTPGWIGRLTFYSDQTVAAHTCDIYTKSVAYNGTGGFKINSTSLTASTPIVTFDGLFAKLWVYCAGSTQPIVTVLACPITR